MALDLTNPQQIRAFREQQLAKGRNPKEVDSFLQSKIGGFKGDQFDTAMGALSTAQLKKDTTPGEYWAQGPAEGSNLLQKMAYGYAKPGVKFLNMLFEPTFGKSERKKTGSEDARFLAPDVYEKVKDDPLAMATLALQRTAGAGQYFVPAGKGANAFLTGGAQGLLSGISETEEGAGLGNVLLSTALGSGIEGGTQMIPKLLNKSLGGKVDDLTQEAKKSLGGKVDDLTQEARKYNSAEEFYNAKGLSDEFREAGIRGGEQFKNFWEKATKGLDKTPTIDSLNPTGGIFVDYKPQDRVTGKLGKNMTTVADTMKKDPDTLITIYRGVPKGVKEINPGDFVSTDINVAKSWSDNNVISKKVRLGDLLDDATEPALGSDSIYRPGVDKQLTDIYNKAQESTGLISKLGKKVQKQGETAELKAKYQRFGRPLKKEGYGGFFKDLEKVDEFKPLLKDVRKGTDDLLESSNQVLKNKGTTIADVADQLTQRGVTMDKEGDEIISWLTDMKKSARPAEKRAINKVLKDLDSMSSEGFFHDPVEYYTSKIYSGKQANWGAFDPSNMKDVSNVWGKVYNKMNDQFDSTLKSQGFDEFRNINKDVSTAIKAQNFAERQLNKVPQSPTRLGLREVITGIGATAAAGPLAGISSILGSRMLTNPGTQELLGRMLQKAGSGAQGLSLAAPAVNPMLSKALGLGALNMPQGQEQPAQQQMQVPTQTYGVPTQQPQQQATGGMQQITPQMLMMGRATLSSQAFNMLKDMYDIQQAGSTGSTGKLTEAQQARKDVLELSTQGLEQLQSGNIKTGKISTPVQQLASMFNVGDQKTLEFNTLISNINGAIAKARAGTTLSPNEEKRLNQYVPQPGDSKQQLETKLKGLVNWATVR